MDLLLELIGVDADSIALVFGGLVVAMIAMVGVAIFGHFRARADVRRRAAKAVVQISAAEDMAVLAKASADPRQRLTKKLLSYVNDKLLTDEKDAKVLRKKLIMAGFLKPNAVAVFFALRVGLGIGLALAGFFLLPQLISLEYNMAMLAGAFGGLSGYLGPSMMLDKRIEARRTEHRVGFPDFMDLMVVCAEAGLSMEAGIERVSREIAGSYPSLGVNLFMTTLELRAGRTLSDALQRLGERLGIEEAVSLATLLQQSEELGSSLVNSLRVYSEEMRHKRLSRAEEKAYALPAKLVVPLTVFIFPVLLTVLMTPVVIRVGGAQF